MASYQDSAVQLQYCCSCLSWTVGGHQTRWMAMRDAYADQMPDEIAENAYCLSRDETKYRSADCCYASVPRSENQASSDFPCPAQSNS